MLFVQSLQTFVTIPIISFFKSYSLLVDSNDWDLPSGPSSSSLMITDTWCLHSVLRLSILGSIQSLDWNEWTGTVDWNSGIIHIPLLSFYQSQTWPDWRSTCIHTWIRMWTVWLACNIFALYASFCQTQYSQHSIYTGWCRHYTIVNKNKHIQKLQSPGYMYIQVMYVRWDQWYVGTVNWNCDSWSVHHESMTEEVVPVSWG